jgi:hypothetical protein
MAIEGFDTAYFTSFKNPLIIVLGLVLGGFIYGFFAAFGKFRGKIKKDEQRNNS